MLASYPTPSRRSASMVIAMVLCSAGWPFGGWAGPELAHGEIAAVWVNSGEDKVTRDELRRSQQKQSLQNSVWDGERVSLFGARNETVSFNVVIETGKQPVKNVRVQFERLAGPQGSSIESRPVTGDGVFHYVDRPIELFFVRYLQIEGLSVLSYEHYDERHIPRRLRRPHDDRGQGTGTWQDRPDHSKHYPDIAVPLEWHVPFSIRPLSNQSIWVDVYVPKTSVAGRYEGVLSVSADDQYRCEIPVTLDVMDFQLFDLPPAKTMVYFSAENINRRYLGHGYPRGGSTESRRSQAIIDRHFQMAHRHRLSLIGDHVPLEEMGLAWRHRLDGTLFTNQRGYDGVGVHVGNNVFSIGTYGTWPWRQGDRVDMWTSSNQWVAWFDHYQFRTPTDSFLYLIDESKDYPLIEKWSQWAKQNPDSGRKLLTMATLPAPQALAHCPSLDIVASAVMPASRDAWRSAVKEIKQRGRQNFIMYNGWRPASGTFTTEDDGVALRQLAWCQFKMAVRRWFAWESTYYRNFQGTGQETNVFATAQTFGDRRRMDESLGATGYNYNNGDGVLFYPGTDQVFSDQSYHRAGPIASLRMKHWRRGIQDVDYLVLAARQDADKVREIVKEMVPQVLWEVGVSDENDPTWVLSDISWPTDPDQWEAARRELAEIITGGAS